MEELFNICKKIIKKFSSFNHTENDEEIILSFAKMAKVFSNFGYDHENILKSLSLFKKKYHDLDEEWFKQQVNFVLYVDKKKINGPCLYLTKLHRIACRIDRKNKTSFKISLTNALLSLLQKEPDLSYIESLIFSSREELMPFAQKISQKEEFVEAFSCINKELRKKKVKDIFDNPELKRKLEII